MGFEAAGFATSWAVEADPLSVTTYSANLPHVPVIQRDVREVSVERDNLEPVDVLHAGFPCQSFSQAGARAGFEDERGKLFFEIIRLLREFGRNRPKILALENAPFLRHGEGGAWFLRLQNEIRKAGYWFRDDNALDLNAYALTKLPQQRNRLFMVALSTEHFSSGRFSFPSEIDQNPKDLADYIDFDAEVEDEYYLAKDNRYYHMISNVVTGDRQLYQLRKYLVRTKNPGVCPTLTANMGLGGHNVPFIATERGLRKLTEYECLALQGFPNGFQFPTVVPKAKRYTQIGNAVAVPVAELLARKIGEKILGAEETDEHGRVRVSA